MVSAAARACVRLEIWLARMLPHRGQAGGADLRVCTSVERVAKGV